MKRLVLLILIVFSVTGVKAQQSTFEQWDTYIKNSSPKNYFNYFVSRNRQMLKVIYFIKYKDEKYLVLKENGSVTKVVVVEEDYFDLMEDNFKDLEYNTSNLLKFLNKYFPNFRDDFKKSYKEIKNVGLRYKTIHCNHYRLPDDVAQIDEEYRPFYSLLLEIVSKMEAALK